MQPPIAEQRTHVWSRPTGPVEDPYAWLSDRDDPATVAYLEAENEYQRQWFEPHGDLKETIFQEIRSRVQETDISVPVRNGDWWYVTRTVEGEAYSIHCRGRSSEGAGDQVVLDENAEAAGHDYFHVGAFDLSPSQRYLAWSNDTDGSEEYLLQIRDLTTGEELPDRIEGTYYGTAWSAGETHLLYTKPDAAMRPHQVWRHEVGTAQADDQLVLEEPDERFFVNVEATRSEEWIIISVGAVDSSEVHVLPADSPTSDLTLVRARAEAHEYSVDHWRDGFVILTNDAAEDFRVMTAGFDAPGEWTELVAHEPGRRITALEPFAGHLVMHEWSMGNPRLHVRFADGSERIVDTSAEPCDVEVGSNPDYHATLLRFDYQSLSTPPSVFEEDVATGVRALLKQAPVPGVDLGVYVSERVWATAPDGAKVPIDVVRHRDTALNCTAPAVLYGYGAYEISVAPWFALGRLSLLDRGWVWALAHPRGGGELGRRWYLDGRLMHKRNSFTDFIACAEHLAATGIAARDRIAIHGGSAGGLLVGATVTMRPDLAAAVIAEVPFVDVVTTMSDPSLPLTVTEWEQWGDPREEPYASYILSYSPYDNTRTAGYPAMYVTAGLNDPRVGYQEPAKWVAKLRTVNSGDRPIVFKVEMGAGHAGPSGRYDTWRDAAQLVTFLLTTV